MILLRWSWGVRFFGSLGGCARLFSWVLVRKTTVGLVSLCPGGFFVCSFLVSSKGFRMIRVLFGAFFRCCISVNARKCGGLACLAILFILIFVLD